MGRLVFFLIILSSNLLADISGTVLDRHSKQPLDNVNIVLEGTGVGTISDTLGNFELHYGKKGIFVLAISRIGFKKKAIEVQNPSFPLTILLEQEPVPTEGITVHGERLKRQDQIKKLSVDEISRIPFIKPDPIISLKSIAGIMAPTDYLGILYVRGSGSDENLYLLDGIELPYLFHFGGAETIVNPMSVQEVRFSSGGFGPQFGNRLSSVIELKRSQPTGKSIFRYRLDPTEIAACYTAALNDNMNYRISARREIINLYLQGLFGDYTNLFVPYFGDFEQSVTYHYPQGMATFSLLRSKDGVDINVPVALSDREDTVSLVWDNMINLISLSVTDSSVLGLICVGIHDYRSQSTFETKRLSNWYWNERDNERTLRLSLKKSLSSTHVLKIGCSYKDIDRNDHQFSGLDYYADLPMSSLYSYAKTNHISAFIQDSSLVWQNIVLNTGLRWDRLKLTADRTISPRIQVTYLPDPRITLYLLWGYYWQHPNFYFLSDYYYKYTLQKKPTSLRANHYIAGVSYSLPNSYHLKIEPYHKEFEDLVCLDSLGFTNNGWGYAYGVDITLRKEFRGGSFGWITYSHCRSKRKILKYETAYTYKAEERDIFNVVLSRTLSWGLRLGIRYRYNTGAPLSPIYGRIYIPPENPDEEEDWDLALGTPNSAHLPPYSRLDLRVDRDFPLMNGTFTVFFCCLNVFDTRNIHDIMVMEESKYYIPIYMLPVLPFVGIEGTF